MYSNSWETGNLTCHNVLSDCLRNDKLRNPSRNPACPCRKLCRALGIGFNVLEPHLCTRSVCTICTMTAGLMAFYWGINWHQDTAKRLPALPRRKAGSTNIEHTSTRIRLTPRESLAHIYYTRTHIYVGIQGGSDAGPSTCTIWRCCYSNFLQI